MAGGELLRALLESFAQGGQLRRAGGGLLGHGLGAAGLRTHGVGKLLAHALQHAGGRADQVFNGSALFAGGLLHLLQQHADLAHEVGALGERGVVALGQAAHLLAQLGDHLGRGLGRFRRGVHEARHRRFERSAQLRQLRSELGGQRGGQPLQALHRGFAPRGLFFAQSSELLRHTGLQLGGALCGAVLARRFFAAEGGELAAPEGGERVHALAVFLRPRGLGLRAGLHQRLGLADEAGHAVEAAAGLLAALFGDGGSTLLQRLQHGLLLSLRLSAGLLPLPLQRLRERLQRGGPGGLLLLVGLGALGQRAAPAGGHRLRGLAKLV